RSGPRSRRRSAGRAGKAERVGERGPCPAAAAGESGGGGRRPVRAWRRGECLTPESCGAGGSVAPAYPRPGGTDPAGGALPRAGTSRPSGPCARVAGPEPSGAGTPSGRNETGDAA
ncbi:unnamed protein product, partial [Gulo gulo]